MIYIVTHDDSIVLPNIEGYKPIKVGKICDYLNEDNINDLNGQISELSAIYQINKYDDEIKGQVHYRRYFLDNGEVLSYKRAKELLEEYDIIVTERYCVGNGIYQNLRSEIGDVEALDKLYNELIKIEPRFKDYLDTTWFNPRQMFICKKDLYKKYCDWIFPLILPLVDKIKSEKPRFIAYMIERLLTFWIKENNLNAIELPYNETCEKVW